MSGEKTEKPTPKRLAKARKDGQIARTQDLGAWVGLLVASFLIPGLGAKLLSASKSLLIQALALTSDPQPDAALELFRSGMRTAFLVVLPLSLPLVATGVLSHVAQGGLVVSTKKLKPDFKHLNPLPGFKRILGPQGLWEGVKSLVKLGVLGLVIWHAVASVQPLLAPQGQLPLSAVLATVASTGLSTMREAAAAGLLLAAADYAVVRRRVNKGLRMSKQDIKDEHKSAEGDPHVKGQIKSRQLQMSRNRMMAEVQNADVVVVNPTHVAVALAYDPAKGAPRVLAKGADHVATKIRALAEEHRIPMIVDVPLARAMYRSVEIGAEIPPELYNAVARVLAFVLSLRSRGSVAGVHRVPVGAGRR